METLNNQPENNNIAKSALYKPSKSLILAIENSQIMLSYITDRGLNVRKELVEIVVKARYLLVNNLLTVDDEISFRMAYREMSKLIKPVTVDSLVASVLYDYDDEEIAGNQSDTDDKNKIKLPKKSRNNGLGNLSRRSVRLYTLFTVLTMVCLLFLQIYFFLGSTCLNNIQKCNKQISEKEERHNELILVLNSGTENPSLSLECESIENDIYELNSEKQCNIDHLKPWVKSLRGFAFSKQINDSIAKNDSSTDVQSVADADMKISVETIQEAQNYLLILGIYILPLLYGLIGGFTFVLRELISEIRNLTFARGTNTKYLLRIILGAIAGLSIGLFWGDIEKTQQFGLASLSPMLLAFIAGYCVEYLFQFLEKFVSGFLKKHETDYDKKDNKQETKSES